MKYILFDLDGTLSDSSEGIINTFKHTLEEMNYEIPSYDELYTFIGPPIAETFEKTLGMSEDEVQQAIKIFRPFYGKDAKFQNELYTGVEEMLKALSEAGYLMGLATSKQELYADQILQHFGIREYFDIVVGASFDDKFSKKFDIMERAIELAKDKYDIESISMVGDRSYDMESSVKLNVEAIGVTYGFGSEEEVVSTGADVVCHTPKEVQDYILNK